MPKYMASETTLATLNGAIGEELHREHRGAGPQLVGHEGGQQDDAERE